MNHEKTIPIITEISIGSDPEVFVYADNLSAIVSSIGLVGGTKDSPKPMSKNGFFVQEDNVLLEFNIPASNTREVFVSNICEGLDLLKLELPTGFTPLVKSSYDFPIEELYDPRAFIMGCDPDFNAWTGKRNNVPDLSKVPGLRSGGGHIHIGYKSPNAELNKKLIRFMDHFLGVPSVILDTDKERRKLYGKAGAYRNKKYGVEYRTLSSFWIANPKLSGWVWDQTFLAINATNNNLFDIAKEEATITSIINSGDADVASLYVEEHGLTLP